MALKDASKWEPVNVQDWIDWSRRDPDRYHEGECERKWNSFKSEGITKSTIYAMALDNGYRVSFDKEYDWDSIIEVNDSQDCLENKEELLSFLKAVFKPGDRVNFVMDSRYDSEHNKYSPSSTGISHFSAKELIERLETRSFVSALGDYNHDAGAWIRFNPVDGKGVGNDNITDFRYALIEADDMEIETQFKKIVELRLPCVTVATSGKRSIHALVHIDAKDYKEYTERVSWLYQTLEEKGFKPDPNNKNPSRLTRMPGVLRGEERQQLIDTQLGYKSFNDFKAFIQGDLIDLPEIVSYAEVKDNLPPLAPELIEGVLRMGHKMIVSGPSKAGKSFSLIELAVAIAEGIRWLDFSCKRGKVLYINLEIDEASFWDRIRKVYEALEIEPKHADNIDVLNLRGHAMPIDQLDKQLTLRLKDKDYTAVIVDPIYKVQSGDENNAGDISRFTNHLDHIATELNVAVIYCHHHSKGAQGQKKAMDRASGSGVFARDADSLMDFIEIIDPTLNLEEFKNCSFWRVEGTLREFAPFKPFNCIFKFPLHVVDTQDKLKNAQIAEGPISTAYKSVKHPKKKSAGEEFDEAFIFLCPEGDDSVSEKELADYFDKPDFEGVRSKMRAAKHLNDGYTYFQNDGRVYKKKTDK